MSSSSSPKADATTAGSEAKSKQSMAFDAFSSFPKRSTDTFSFLPKRSTALSEQTTHIDNTNVPEFRRGARSTSENVQYSVTPIHPTSDTCLIQGEKPHGRDSVYPGLIIYAIYLNTPWADQPHRIDEDLTNLSRSKYGWVHSKQRPMVVLTTHARHMVVIPLRSFSGRGVDHLNNTPDVKKEYIPVKGEAHHISNIDIEGQDYLRLIAPFESSNTGTCLCMTEVHSINYRTPFWIPRNANKLTAHSTKALLRAYKKSLYQSIDDGLVQAAQLE